MRLVTKIAFLILAITVLGNGPVVRARGDGEPEICNDPHCSCSFNYENHTYSILCDMENCGPDSQFCSERQGECKNWCERNWLEGMWGFDCYECGFNCRCHPIQPRR